MSPSDIGSITADALGVLSGLLLGWSAVRINRLLREAWELGEMLIESKSGLENKTYAAMQEKAKKLAAQWDTRDQIRLCAAIGLLVASFGCKIWAALAKAPVF
ncbi:MAG: hypothetical protein FJY56_15050 [Betaproteobacteria bacterium]|nr:hypothetical protein [Betaproteobacteria bacterium]